MLSPLRHSAMRWCTKAKEAAGQLGCILRPGNSWVWLDWLKANSLSWCRARTVTESLAVALNNGISKRNDFQDSHTKLFSFVKWTEVRNRTEQNSSTFWRICVFLNFLENIGVLHLSVFTGFVYFLNFPGKFRVFTFHFLLFREFVYFLNFQITCVLKIVDLIRNY